MLKRIFSLFLCLVLLISAVPVQVFADGEDGGDIILGENELPPIPIDPPETEAPSSVCGKESVHLLQASF